MGKYINNLFGGQYFKGDAGVWMIYFFLCMISIVEVYSASSRLTFDGGNHWGPVVSQAGFLAVGFIIILLCHRVACKWFMLAPFPLFFAVVLLAYTSLFGSSEVNDTHRWFNMGGISFQPSELVKPFLIMTVAMVLAKTQGECTYNMGNGKTRKVIGAVKRNRNFAFKVIGIITLTVCGLIFLDNVSTALMLFTVITIMMFIGRVPYDLMFKGLAALCVVGAFVVALCVILPEDTLQSTPGLKRMATVKHRVERMFTKSQHEDGEADKSAIAREAFSDKNSQTTYAKIAIANSNVIGRGPGNSVQRDFLQHAESDFIYAIIIEELGIFGALFVAFLYLALLIRVGRIAQKSTTFFPAYLVVGLGLMMTLQAFVNMGVAVDLLPVTGQTLPLISKGGTSILITSFYIAVILSVSRYVEKKQQKAKPVVAMPNGETSEYYTDGPMA